MNEPKPMASLSPSLLARKGGARPAMRPQLQAMNPQHQPSARQLEDLGFNDMGDDQVEEAAAPPSMASHTAPGQPQAPEVVAITPQAAPSPAAPSPFVPEFSAPPQAALPQATPVVVQQQASIARRVGARSQRRSALAEGRAAAFTLRLDAKRHFDLRLACTLANRSAQQLITDDALDRMISDLPEVAAMAALAAKHR